MKTKYLLLIFAIASQLACWASPMDEANNAYKNRQYNEAIELYNRILDEGNVSAALYYNLGNAYYRTNSYGLAILSYERALKLSPRDREIQENLALANSKTQDNITPLPQFAVVRWIESIHNCLGSNGWKLVTLCLLALLGCCVTVFVLSQSIGMRKGMIFSGAAVLLLLILSISGIVSSTQKETLHNEAIVLRTAVNVKGAPDSHSVDMFVLHEGAKVTLTDKEDGWHKIQIADGNQGWLESDVLGII